MIICIMSLLLTDLTYNLYNILVLSWKRERITIDSQVLHLHNERHQVHSQRGLPVPITLADGL